jgi:hypothetical protein
VLRGARAAALLGAALAVLASARASPAPARDTPKLGAALALLRSASGTLWWSSDNSCRIGLLRPRGLVVRQLPGEHCRVWPSPSGRLAVATVGTPAYLLVNRRLSVLRRVGAPLPDVQHPVGYLDAPVAWSPGERALAVCLQTDRGVALARITLAPRATRLVPHRCDPAWLPDGRLVVADGARLLVGGRQVLDARVALGRADAAVMAVADGGGLIVASVASEAADGVVQPPGLLVVLRPDGRQVLRRPLPATAWAAEVGVAPDGSAVWWFDAQANDAHLEPLRGARLPADAPTTARWYAWSPRGRFVAAATASGIVVAGPGGRSALLPGIVVHDLAWTN